MHDNIWIFEDKKESHFMKHQDLLPDSSTKIFARKFYFSKPHNWHIIDMIIDIRL